MLYLANKTIYDNPTHKYIYKGDIKNHQYIPKHKSLFYTKEDKGLPIGNLTSQFFANVYLDMMDNYIKRVLKVKSYVRYVDDFILFGDSKEKLLSLKSEIEKFVFERLKLFLRDSFKLLDVKSGIDFLGYIIRLNMQIVII
jgi:retron-type reverse transcriptase